MTTISTPFFDTISLLRNNEQVLLYTKLMAVPPAEALYVKEFLKNEYEKESTTYPKHFPAFDADAALWASKIIYHASQLILYRENKSTELENILPPFENTITASAILSADLCLRFLPHILEQVNFIDSADDLRNLLEKHLQQWHYSGIGYALPVEDLDFETIQTDPSLMQLYMDRVMQKKVGKLAALPPLKEKIMAAMGDYKQIFWKELA